MVEKKEVEKEPIIENLSSEDNLVEVASNEVGVKNEKPNGNGGRQEGNGNSKGKYGTGKWYVMDKRGKGK